MPPSGSFISFATAACKLALVLTTIGYAGVVAHRMRAQNTQLRKAVDDARAERERLLEHVELERTRAAVAQGEKREEFAFWVRMDSLARAEVMKKDEALVAKEAELALQREQIRDLRARLEGTRIVEVQQSPSQLGGGWLAAHSPNDDSQLLTDRPDPRPAIAELDEVVLHMVRTLNLEISEVASQVTNAFRVVDTPDPEIVTQAFERARVGVGPVMAELLESIQHQDDPILIDIALKADMVGFAAEIASAWDFQHQSKSVFTGVYKQMRRSEPQSVCGMWRAHARKYSKQRLYNGRDLAVGFSHQLAERIADILVIAGASYNAEEIHAEYARHLETIVRNALDLQRIIGEEIVVCDYEVLAVRIDEVFDADLMEDIYNGEIAAAGPPGTMPHVLVTADLGLRRSVRGSGAVEAEGVGEDDITTTMLLMPKVVLDTVVYELGLVDEEDASPSTAEPST